MRTRRSTHALAALLLQPAGGADSSAFTHALIRHTLYADLSPSRQVRLHRAVADALEAAASGALSPAAAGEIAAQCDRSRELPGAERGVEAAPSAAAHAETAGRQAEAARSLRIALDLLPEGDRRHPQLLGRLGMALIWSLAFDEGFAVATRAAGAIGRFGALEAPFESRAEVLTRSGNYICLACYAGDFTRCVPLARAEPEQSLSRGQVVRAARCFMVVGICEGSLGLLDEGRAALSKAEQLIAPGGGASIFGILHGQEMLTAYIDDEEALRRVASDFTRLLPTLVPGQAWAVGPALAVLARTAARLGQQDEALDHLGRLVPWLERAPAWTIHFPQIVGYAGETLWVLDRLDHVDVIEDALQEKVLGPRLPRHGDRGPVLPGSAPHAPAPLRRGVELVRRGSHGPHGTGRSSSPRHHRP